MELLKMRSCCFLAIILLAVFAECTDARSATHGVRRRDADVNYGDDDDELALADAADGDFLNDADGDEDDGDSSEGDATSGPPDEILSTAGNFFTKAGSSVSLPCETTNPESVVIIWRKDGEVLFQGPHSINSTWKLVLHRQNHSLEIPEVQASDAGQYSCEMMADGSARGLQQKIQHLLTVVQEIAPRIVAMTPQGDDSRVVEGAVLTITCEVEGVPKPSITWSKERNQQNKRLMPGDGEFSANSVTIRNVKREHAGKYICMADNGIQRPATAAVNIQVVGKPRVHVHKAVVNSALGMEALLACTVHEEPQSIIRWLKDGQPIEETQDMRTVTEYPSSTLTIFSVTQKDFGTYTCEATNQYGSHARSVELVPEPVLEALGGDGPALAWHVHSHAPLEFVELEYRRIDGEQDGEWVSVKPRIEEPQDKHVYLVRHELTSLAPGKYEAHARARNQYGWSALTSPYFFDGAYESPERYQTAQVGPTPQGSTSSANFIRNSITILSTVFTCLLIRLI